MRRLCKVSMGPSILSQLNFFNARAGSGRTRSGWHSQSIFPQSGTVAERARTGGAIGWGMTDPSPKKTIESLIVAERLAPAGQNFELS